MSVVTVTVPVCIQGTSSVCGGVRCWISFSVITDTERSVQNTGGDFAGRPALWQTTELESSIAYLSLTI